MLKMYVQDNHWAGQIVAIAVDIIDAREKMKTCENYDSEQPIEELEIKAGQLVYNLGDM